MLDALVAEARLRWGFEPAMGLQVVAAEQLIASPIEASRPLVIVPLSVLRPTAADEASAVTPGRTPGPDEPKGVDGPLALLTLATVGGVVGFVLIVRRHKRRVHEHEDTKLLHNATHSGRLCRKCIVFTVSMRAASLRRRRSDPTARSSSSRQRPIMSVRTWSTVN